MRARIAVTAAILLAGWTGAAWAYPTALNLIPTADVADRGTCNLQVEFDGSHTPFTGEGAVQLYSEFGLGRRFEAGVDLVDLNRCAEWHADAKWQFLPESRGWPAMAVGAVGVARNGPDVRCSLDADWYVVLSRDVGRARLHGGYLNEDSGRALFGAEYQLAEPTSLLADWTTGPEAYHTLGLAQDVGGDCTVLLYWARNNTRHAGNFVGLNLSWTGRFCRHESREKAP